MKSPRSRSSTPPFAARLKPSFVRMWCTGIAAMLLTACGLSMPRLPELLPSPLVVASCPPLTPLADDTFGATTLKLVEVAGQYAECRAAALAGRPATSADYSLGGKLK